MKMRRHTTIVGAIIVGPLIISMLALIVLLNLDWNRIKPWLDTRASEALERPVTIVGDLALSWEPQSERPDDKNTEWRGMVPWPHLVAQDVHIGNPQTVAASAPGDFASIKKIAFSLNPFALLDRKISIPLLSFDTPVITLWRDVEGRNNWTFKMDDHSSPWQLDLRRVILTRGSIHLIDAIKHADVIADIDTIADDSAYGIGWQLRGKFNDQTISGTGKASALLSLRRQNVPYPIVAFLHAGQTAISIEGSLTKPTDLAAIDMRLKVSGANMAHLYALTGIVLPETSPYTTEGHLSGTLSAHSAHWIYEKFKGRVGASDIGGSLDYQTKQPRALLSGTVVSHFLQFSDLAPVIGADSNASKEKRGSAVAQPANKVLPIEPFKTERWTSIDTDIQFSAEKIIRKKALPIDNLTTRVHLQDGVLSLSPLDFGIAGGKLNSNVTLDGRNGGGPNAIKANMKLAAHHLKLKQLFPTLPLLQDSAGEIDGDASLSAIGNSVASLLGAANGEIKAVIDKGAVSKLLLEEMGLNVGNVILINVLGDKQVNLNCVASDFAVTNGLMQARSFVVDTDAAVLDVSGNINLSQEQIDLTIRPNSIGLRVFSLRTPLYVRGSFKQPKVTIDKGALVLKAAEAVALAALAPVAALIPLTNTGQRKDSICPALLANARVSPVAPPPGKVYPHKASVSAK